MVGINEWLRSVVGREMSSLNVSMLKSGLKFLKGKGARFDQ
jgi:hypothetical protein